MPSSGGREKVVRRRLASGVVKEYRYSARPARSRTEPGSLTALIEAWRRSPEWAATAPTTQRYRLIYLRDLEPLGAAPVKAVRRRIILLVRDAIATTRGHGAANVFVKIAGSLFTWAVDHDWLETSPVARIRHLPGGHLPAWTVQEADTAIAHLPDPLARAVLMARYTGQRRGDLCSLTWAAYDGNSIRLRQQKTGASLVIPAHPTLKAALDQWKRGAVSTHVLTAACGTPWQATHLTHSLADALLKIGLRPGLGIHGLRKLAAAELRMPDAASTKSRRSPDTGAWRLSLCIRPVLIRRGWRAPRSSGSGQKTAPGKRWKMTMQQVDMSGIPQATSERGFVA